MDVKQITARLNHGVVYEGIVQDIEDLLASGNINQIEYDELMKKVSEINSSFSKENTIVVKKAEEAPVLSVSQMYTDHEVKTLYTTTATTPDEENVEDSANHDIDGEGNESGASDDGETAENAETNAETNTETNTETETPEEDAASEDTQSDTHEESNNVAPWVSDYHTYMMEWSARNPERRLSKFEAEENSFRAEFKDEVVLNFSSPSDVAVKTSDPDSPKASDFDALLEVAKKSNQNIKLSDKMSESFRKALIEACAKADVKIINLSAEDADLYMSFVSEDNEETTLNNNNEENQVENNETNANADTAPRTAEDEVVIAMPETLDREDDLLESDSGDSKASSVEDTDNTVDTAKETQIENKSSTEVDNPKGKKKGRKVLQRVANSVKNAISTTKEVVRQKAPIAMVTIGTTATVLAGCNTATQKQNNDPNVQEVNDPTIDALADSAYNLTAADFAGTQTAADTISVPTEWNESMRTNDGYSEDYFKIVKRFYEKLGYDWAKAYKNASTLSSVLSTEDHKFSALQILSGLYSTHFTLNVTSEGSKGYANFDSGILAPYDLKTLSDAILCNPKALNMENLNYYRCILSADEHGTVNLFTLSELNSRFSKLPHDEKGRAIGTKCNYADGVVEYPCGAQKQVRYVLRDCGCGKKVTHTIEVALDTTIAQTTPVEIDTIAKEQVAPVDTTTKKAVVEQTIEYEPELRVNYTTNLGKAPTAKLLNTFTTDETQINPGTKVGTKRWTTKNQNRGYYTSTTAEEVNEEVRNPGVSKAKAAEKRKQAAQEQNYSYEENGNTYNWPVNQSEGR